MIEKIDERLIYHGSYPDGFYNVGVEFTATEEGLECDITGSLIPWEWLDDARKILTEKSDV